MENLQEKGQPKITSQSLCELAQSQRTWTYHKSRFTPEFTGKVSEPKIATQSLCEPVQSQCTWTCDKSRFLRENLQEKCRGPRSRKSRAGDFVRACAVEMHMNISKEHFYARIYRKNDGEQNAYSDLTPALTLTVRTPQWTHRLGNKKTFRSTTSEVPELIFDAAAVPATEAIAPRHH